jgi:hypothetical protein
VSFCSFAAAKNASIIERDARRDEREKAALLWRKIVKRLGLTIKKIKRIIIHMK